MDTVVIMLIVMSLQTLFLHRFTQKLVEGIEKREKASLDKIDQHKKQKEEEYKIFIAGQQALLRSSLINKKGKNNGRKKQ